MVISMLLTYVLVSVGAASLLICALQAVSHWHSAKLQVHIMVQVTLGVSTLLTYGVSLGAAHNAHCIAIRLSISKELLAVKVGP